MPYKYATQLHATQGIYAWLFPFSAILALLGLGLAAKPTATLRWPLWLRSALTVMAAGWIATGVLCIPSLTKTTLSAPLAGLFATFHMLAQHVFLSLALILFLLVPGRVFSLFHVVAPSSRKEEASVPSSVDRAAAPQDTRM